MPEDGGEWYLAQESQITGDERTSRKNQITFKAKLSIPQCRWNFLRSQSIEQVEGGDVDAEKSDIATLDFNELGECIALRGQHVRAPDQDIPPVARPQGDDDGGRDARVGLAAAL